MTDKIWIDCETFNTAPISEGAYKYAESAEVLLIAYAVGDAPVQVIDLTAGADLPCEFTRLLDDPNAVFIAHNSAFDRTVLSRHFSELSDPIRWNDTMILALAASLPASLNDLCTYFDLPVDQAKDKDGKRLISLFCKPQKNGERVTSKDRPEDWRRFIEYCRRDVESMRLIYKRLPQGLYPSIWEDWRLDQKINDRGIGIDLELARAAVCSAEAVKNEINDRVKQITGGAVCTITQTAALLKHLAGLGVDLPNLQSGTVSEALSGDLPTDAKELLELRKGGAKSSLAKYEALMRCCNDDNRLRGTLLFMGASRTGRFAGRLFQPQNLPRGTLTPAEVEAGIQCIKSGLLSVLCESPAEVLSSCLRGAIVPSKGHKLVVADLSNIEGRVLAWLAGESWKIHAFSEYDAGRGVDLYKATYGRTFGVDPAEVTKQQRQIGKVLELAMGYQGGVGAFLNFANLYRVDLNELADHVRSAVSPELIAQGESAFDRAQMNGMTFDLSRKVYSACDAIKIKWRQAHPQICKFWADIAAGVRVVLNNDAREYRAGRVVFFRTPHGLLCRLPSGRHMTYPRARLDGDNMIYYGALPGAVGKYGFVRTYSGKICENITQAVARDILIRGMHNAEAKGYKTVLTVHDELITETPDSDFYTAEKLAEAMSGFYGTGVNWAEGLPLSAAGFCAYRYKKD